MIQVTNFFDKYSEITFDIGVLIHGIVFILSNIYGTNFSRVELNWFLVIWSFGLFFLSIKSRNDSWIRNAFFLLTIYNVFDCLNGSGYLFQTYEMTLFLGILLYSYFKFKHKWTPYFYGIILFLLFLKN